jgi:hypothetical protein
MNKVEVTWIDAHSEIEWAKVSSMREKFEDINLTVTTVGYVIEDSSGRIILCGDLSGDEEDGNIWSVIPREMIISVSYLEKVDDYSGELSRG